MDVFPQKFPFISVGFQDADSTVVPAEKKVFEFGHVVGSTAFRVQIDENVGLPCIGQGVGEEHHGERAVGYCHDVVLVFLLVDMVEVEGNQLFAATADGRHGQILENAAVHVVDASDLDGIEDHRNRAGSNGARSDLSSGEYLGAAMFHVGGDDAGGDGEVFQPGIRQVFAQVFDQWPGVEHPTLGQCRRDDVLEEAQAEELGHDFTR